MERQLRRVLLAVVRQDLLHDRLLDRPVVRVPERDRLAAVEVADVRVGERVLREDGPLALRRLHALDALAHARVVLRRNLHGVDREAAARGEDAVRDAVRAAERIATLDRDVVRQRQDRAHRLAETDRQRLLDLRRRIDVEREAALLERGRAGEEPVRRAELAREEGRDELVARLAAHERLRHLHEDARRERPRRVLQVRRLDRQVQELRTRRRVAHEPLEHLAAVVGLLAQEDAAVDRVVEAEEVDARVEQHRAVLGERPVRDDPHLVRLGGRHLRDVQVLAVRRRHEVGAVAEVGRHQVAARFVRRVHQDEAVPVRRRGTGRAHGDDGVVEVGLRHLPVHLRAGVDEDGIRLEARDAQHRHEERRLVAADAVAVAEGDLHVVRRVAGRGVLHRQAHVADLLRHPLVERLDPRQFRRVRRRQDLLHLVRDAGGRLLEVRDAQVPVPLRERRPVLRGRDAHVLHLRVKGRHVRLLERLRRVRDRPRVADAAVRQRLFRVVHVAERVAHGGVDERALLRRDEGDGAVEHRHRPFEHRDVRELVLDARLEVPAARRILQHVADLEPGDGADDLARLRVVDVLARRGVVRRLLRRRRDVDRALDAVRADGRDAHDLRDAVAAVEADRDRALVDPPLLGQDLDGLLLDGDERAVRLEFRRRGAVDQHRIRVGILFQRDVIVDAERRQGGESPDRRDHHDHPVPVHRQSYPVSSPKRFTTHLPPWKMSGG